METNKSKIETGFAVLLKSINLFNYVNNIEMIPYSGAALSRAAGASCLLVGKKKIIKLF